MRATMLQSSDLCSSHRSMYAGKHGDQRHRRTQRKLTYLPKDSKMRGKDTAAPFTDTKKLANFIDTVLLLEKTKRTALNSPVWRPAISSQPSTAARNSSHTCLFPSVASASVSERNLRPELGGGQEGPFYPNSIPLPKQFHRIWTFLLVDSF